MSALYIQRLSEGDYHYGLLTEWTSKASGEHTLLVAAIHADDLEECAPTVSKALRKKRRVGVRLALCEGEGDE